MEELTGAVLQDFYPGCEVHLCGKSGDGGIDLLVVVKDVPVAIQVKRRTKPDSTESVEAVRAFLGASLLKGYDHLIFVTTADHFTGGPFGAEKAAERALQKKLVQKFQLIDRHKFFEMLNLVTTGPSKNWVKPLPPMFRDLASGMYLPLLPNHDPRKPITATNAATVDRLHRCIPGWLTYCYSA
jgi:hypothetical protein